MHHLLQGIKPTVISGIKMKRDLVSGTGFQDLQFIVWSDLRTVSGLNGQHTHRF